ncbi:DGQHR domain-containing protein [Burkholderia pseudomallei]|uniref:DGQHR domain-containing protein n=1 Tax=Burkholderia pseudomallei TaxID=28450 RepID=UPI0009B5BC27|nr:DGQHR domain-containing protein [Burkholderia pseudomallei]
MATSKSAATGKTTEAARKVAPRKTARAQSNENGSGRRIRLSASLILQAGKQFFSVTMPTDTLSECCFVTSREEDPVHGFQRVLDKKRAEDIAHYIDHEAGTIPGSIILSAQPEAMFKIIGGKTVEFTIDRRSFLVLDGQHRVYGFHLAERAIRVPVVIYTDLSPTEEARLFIDINTKQRQVPNELLLDIKRLAQREHDKEIILRDIFDIFSERENSALLGLMSPAARQKNKISRVTFNLAFKAILGTFSAPTAENVFSVTNAYISAFADGLETVEMRNWLTSPIMFRAMMETFPEIARISAAQHGKAFSKARFASIINPIFSQISPTRVAKTKSPKDMAGMFAQYIKKDFSI